MFRCRCWVGALVSFMGIGWLVKKPSSFTTRVLDMEVGVEGLESQRGVSRC